MEGSKIRISSRDEATHLNDQPCFEKLDQRFRRQGRKKLSECEDEVLDMGNMC